MFEQSLWDADDDALVGVIEERSRQEAREAAQRLAAIAELTSRRCDKEGVRAHWACDGWDSVAGEVAAALGVSPKKASSQMSLALALRHRMPKVAALFAQGKVSYRVITVINWRTHLVDSEDAMANIDAKLAERAARWEELSDYKLAQSIDYWVDRFDRDAVQRVRTTARSRDLHVGKRDDESETTAIWGRLYATDAAALDRRLMAIAETVCEDDPRTTAQRRADAMGVLTAGGDRLACSCANPDCPAAESDGRASNVVIHVVTEAAALDAAPDPQMNSKDVRTRTSPAKPAAVLIKENKIVPAPLLAELIRSGAKVREVEIPADIPESGYRPSAKLEEFIKVRDLTCRFPGCEEPAEFCDIDHTVPYPVGPTHPSNLKALCRKHHLLKTFWTGAGGWRDEQLPDGTVIWTAPTGRTYKTLPGSWVFFPRWRTTTAELPKSSGSVALLGDRTLMMPKRRRTRAAERTRCILVERELNAAERAARNKPPPPPAECGETAGVWDINSRNNSDDDDNDPPPF